MNFGKPIPEKHAQFLEHALPELQSDRRLAGVAAGGSFVTGTMDEFSDLDLIIAVEPPAVAEVMQEREKIASRLGSLVNAFTGEHVSEPRLLICLYDPPLLHVDLKFVSLADVARRVEDPHILWERDNRVSAGLSTQKAAYPLPDLQWIETRFWAWVHYIAAKIGRGEIFEAVDSLSFLRTRVLGPLSLMEAGAQPAGVRKIEQLAPGRARELTRSIAAYNQHACVISLHAAIAMYVSLRNALGNEDLRLHTRAEQAALNYFHNIAKRYV